MVESRIVDTHVETYIRSLLVESEPFLADLMTYAEAHHVPIVHPEIAQFFKVFLKTFKPKAVLEIGTAIGYSGALIAMEMKSGTLDTIELNEAMYNKAKETFEQLKEIVPEVTVNQHLGDAAQVLGQIDKRFDLIFIDAAKGHYQTFFDLCYPMLNDGGIIISDNVLYKGMIATDEYLVRRKITIVKRMRKYLQYISNHPELSTTIMPMGDGLAISIKKGGSA